MSPTDENPKLKLLFTQIPNLYLDEAMRILSPAEFKVLMVISRFTWGWHISEDQISLSILVEYTALSRMGVLNCVDRLEEVGLIEITRGNAKGHTPNKYKINKNWTVPTSKLSSPVEVNTSKLSSPVNSITGKLSGHIKERGRKKQEKENERLSPPTRVKTLDPEIKKWADQVYQIDRVKFKPLARWIAQAQKERFSDTVIAAALRDFLPYAEGINGNWWPYLDKIVYKIQGKSNAREFEQEHEERKRSEADFAKGLKELFGGIVKDA